MFPFEKKLTFVRTGGQCKFWLGVVEGDVEMPQTKKFLVNWLSTFPLDHDYHQKVHFTAFSFVVTIFSFLLSMESTQWSRRAAFWKQG